MKMQMQAELKFIALEARRRANDYAAFRYYVELDERSDAELDSLVMRIVTPIITAIDCTQCANCCRILDVYLTETDAHRLATGLGVPLEELIDGTINRERAKQEEEWGVLARCPCHFLDGRLCSVYPFRPQSCRMYPQFTPDFRWTLEDILGGVGKCPIIYHVIEQLQAELNW